MKFVCCVIVLFVSVTAQAFECAVSKISTGAVLQAEEIRVTEGVSMFAQEEIAKGRFRHFAVGEYNGYRFIQIVRYQFGAQASPVSSATNVGAWTSGILNAQDTESDTQISCRFI